MSDRYAKAEALKKVFAFAKHAPRYKDGSIDDLDLHGELQGALYQVGNDCFDELKDEVYPYLSDIFAEYREEAVRTLCGVNGLKLPEFKDLAYKMWLNDPDINVKRAALTAWAGYYDKTKDSMVLKNLYNIIKHDKYDVTIRVWALYSFMYVADAFDCPREKSEIFDLDELEDNKQLNKAIYWGKINRIMGQYVPGWPKQYG